MHNARVRDCSYLFPRDADFFSTTARIMIVAARSEMEIRGKYRYCVILSLLSHGAVEFRYLFTVCRCYFHLPPLLRHVREYLCLSISVPYRRCHRFQTRKPDFARHKHDREYSRKTLVSFMRTHAIRSICNTAARGIPRNNFPSVRPSVVCDTHV